MESDSFRSLKPGIKPNIYSPIFFLALLKVDWSHSFYGTIHRHYTDNAHRHLCAIMELK